MEETVQKELKERTSRILQEQGSQRLTMADTFHTLIDKPWFFAISIIPGCLMYGILFLYGNPYLKYIFERILMTVFVILGVATLVFTILYLSPFNPAPNILGETATQEQIAHSIRCMAWISLILHSSGTILRELLSSILASLLQEMKT